MDRKAGKNPAKWSDVRHFLQLAGASPAKAKQSIKYVDKVLSYETEFSRKSKADKKLKKKKGKNPGYRCTVGHWVTIDDRPVFICD